MSIVATNSKCYAIQESFGTKMFFEGFIGVLIKTDKILLTIENYHNK